jgi:YwiC-like protein
MTSSGPHPATGAPSRRLWFPRQHGAWAMLAVPLLMGVAASEPDAWQIVLAVAAVAGYLASATAQAWLRARRRPSFVPSLIAYGSVAGLAGLALVVTHPALLLSAVVLVPATLLVLTGARPGTPRDLVNSFAQTAIALVLLPSAAYVSGDFDAPIVARSLIVAGGYLAGSVLMVRSVLRERGNPRYLWVSIGFHAAMVAVFAAVAGWVYAAYGLGLLARAAALPVLERRRAGTSRPLRPIQVGVVEIVASTVLVVLAFVSPVSPASAVMPPE